MLVSFIILNGGLMKNAYLPVQFQTTIWTCNPALRSVLVQPVYYLAFGTSFRWQFAVVIPAPTSRMDRMNLPQQRHLFPPSLSIKLLAFMMKALHWPFF